MYFYFNNNISDDLNIVLSDFPVLPFVQEEIKQVEVGGVFGTLTKRTGKYKDLSIAVECALLDMENYHEAIRKINNWCYEIEDNRLFFSDNAEKCYKVKKVTIGDIKNELTLYGSFTIEFLCYPFIFNSLESEIEITNSCEYLYNGDIETYPRVVLEDCTGNIQITFNDNTTQFNEVEGTVVIDYPQVLNGDIAITNKMIGNFPTLEKGINNISWAGTIGKVKIKENALYRG
ncbi:MAG: phage tail family protein [Peptostreptococcaceae bacterium]|nr:phage tail family protein [Peptostreptococcaceae bacterium]